MQIIEVHSNCNEIIGSSRNIGLGVRGGGGRIWLGCGWDLVERTAKHGCTEA